MLQINDQSASLPALLRAGRAAYGRAIQHALRESGHADIPRDGVFVIGAIARHGSPLSQVIAALGTSKQAAGQLVDTLILRFYLARKVDPDDRRRLTVALTKRGNCAAGVIRSAIKRVDAELLRRVGPDTIAHTRIALAALADSSHTVSRGNEGGETPQT